MKRLLVPFIVLVVLFGSWGTVFGQGKGKGRPKVAGRAVEKGHNKGGAKAGEVESAKDKGKGEVERANAGKDSTKGKGKAKEAQVSKGREAQREMAKGHAQQLAALQKQMSHEEAKHLKRVARINRILTLAREKGDTKAIERVDKLKDKEQRRYVRKMERVQKARQRIMGLQEGTTLEEKKAAGKGEREVKVKGRVESKGKGKGDDREAEKRDDE